MGRCLRQVRVVPLLLTLPTAVSIGGETLVGPQLARDTEDDLSCRDPRVLMHGLARNSVVSKMSLTMAYRLSPYSPERDDQL